MLLREKKAVLNRLIDLQRREKVEKEAWGQNYDRSSRISNNWKSDNSTIASSRVSTAASYATYASSRSHNSDQNNKIPHRITAINNIPKLKL